MTRVQWAALTVPGGSSVDVVADNNGTTTTLSIEDPGDVPAGGGGGLEDPGEVFEPSTAVSVGHRIAETVQGQSRVFEVTVAGTTGGIEPFTEYWPTIVPLSTTSTGSETWRYLGIVGQLPWTVAPILPGVSFGPDVQGVGSYSNELRIVNAGAPEDSAGLISIRVTVGGVEMALFEAATDGDADWLLDENTGAGFRWSAAADGVSGNAIAEVTYEHFKTFGTTIMSGLPTADPANPGELWVDVAAGRVLKVSAG